MTGRKPPQFAHQSKKCAEAAPAPGAQADHGNAGEDQFVGEGALSRETKDGRLPAAAIEPIDKLHESPLGPTGVEIGDAKRNADAGRCTRHS